MLCETPPLAPAIANTLDSLWQQIMEAVGRVSAFTRSCLQGARPISLAKGVLTIGFDPEFADRFELVNNTRTQTLLQTKLQEHGHPGMQIKFVRAEVPATPAVQSALAPASPALARPLRPPRKPRWHRPRQLARHSKKNL